MSENASTGAASEGEQTGAEGAGAAASAEGAATGTQTPEGFVPRADMEREQARARAFQAEADKLKAAAAATASQAEGAATGGDAGSGFDPDSFRRQMLQEVVGVTQLAQSAPDLREKFPHANPAIFTQLGEFGSVDALRVAVEDSHNRVAAILASEKEAMTESIRAEFEEKFGGGTGTPSSGATTHQAGDPTVAQLAAMSVDEMNALEARSPGTVERVMRSAA